jgi:ankyrin repeat protein
LHVARKGDWTTIITAAKNGYVEVFRELLKHRAYVNIANSNFSEILNIAAQNGHVNVIRELLKIGGSVKISKKRGWKLFS